MKKQQLKLGLFAATISVLLISMSNLPIAYAGVTVPTGTLTVVEFCNLNLGAAVDMTFLDAIQGEVRAGTISLINTGTGKSTAAMTGAPWTEPNAGPTRIALALTTFAVASNSIPATAFTGSPQTLGPIESTLAGGSDEIVVLSVTVTTTPVTFTGPLELVLVVAETACIAT